MENRISIQTLSKLGIKKKKIAEQIGCHRNTIRNIEKENPIKPKVNRDDAIHPLDSFREFIQSKLNADIQMTNIYEILVSEMNYNGGYDSLRKYVKSRKLKSNNNVYIVINTGPAKEAQVDFGYVGPTPDNTGKPRKTWVFVMTLGFSRNGFHKAVYDQSVGTFIECHIEAFEYLSGVPEVVKIDNLKAAIIKASKYEPEYQKEYLEFSKYYGFKILPCKVRYPEEKGKVESGVKYVKNNFFKGKKFNSKTDLDLKLKDWQERICNSREHGTIKKIPKIIFNDFEKSKLIPLPDKAWEIFTVEKRTVNPTCHISIGCNYYSVPYKYIGESVEVKIGKNSIKIYETKTNTLTAIHNKLIDRKGEYCTNKSHYPDYKNSDLQTEYQYTQLLKIKDIGEYAYKHSLKIKDTNTDTWYRSIKGILSLEKIYGKEAVNLSCKRALAYEVYNYQIILKLCQNLHYKEEIPDYLNVDDNNKENVKENIATNSSIARPLTYYAKALFSFFN